MKIKEIQRKGENLYTVTFEKRTLWRRKEVVRDVYSYAFEMRYAQSGQPLGFKLSSSVTSLIPDLIGNEPLKVN